MKKTGSTSDFMVERDRDLHRSFMEVLRTSRAPLREMFGMAARRTSRRFWVSEERAAIVVGAMLRGETDEKMIPKRREMFEEILRRVKRRMDSEPGLCMTHAVAAVVHEAAPEFYLTDESARSIIYRIRRKRR